MKQRIWLTLSLAAVLATAVLFAQGFNARLGTWEFTLTMQGDIPLEFVPPAMRAQFEAEMRKPQVFKSCVTADDLKSLSVGKTSDDDDCEVVTSKITAAVGDVTRECTGDMPRTETAHYEALTPQTMKATIVSKSATGTMTMNVAGKWMAAECRE